MNRLFAITVSIMLSAAMLASACEPPKPSSPTVKGPFTHANLTVFLLHGPDVVKGRKFMTLQEAMEQKKLIVHETEAVNQLSVENISTDAEVFIQSGDIVRGGKQDRLLAVDLIVPPKSGKLPIPSFCCESGRWRQRGGEDSKAFASSMKQAANKDVKLALNAARDQSTVWEKVRQAQMKLSENVGKSVNSPQSPSSYQLTLEDKDLLKKIEEYTKALSKIIDGQDDVVGVVLVVNGKVAGAEIYGSSSLFKKLWPKLLEGAATDAFAEWKKDLKLETVKTAAVERFLADAEKGKLSEVALGGEGRLSPNDSNRAPNQAANPPQQQQQVDPRSQRSPSVAIKYDNIKHWQRDSDKILMLECQDVRQGKTVVHRSYIAK